MSRRLLHYLYVVLLLVAQQSAITHTTWHAGGGARTHESGVHEHDTGHESPSGQRSLCALDLAFGQVLGGVHGSCAVPAAAGLPAAIAIDTFNPRLGSEAVPALSRGPPFFL